jgi:hypothetical protein
MGFLPFAAEYTPGLRSSQAHAAVRCSLQGTFRRFDTWSVGVQYCTDGAWVGVLVFTPECEVGGKARGGVHWNASENVIAGNLIHSGWGTSFASNKEVPFLFFD